MPSATENDSAQNENSDAIENTVESSTVQSSTVENGAPQKRSILRRMYDWVLSWANSAYGTVALFLVSFAESSFFPIPPDPLLLALAVGRKERSLFYGAVCTVGSVLGGLFGYWIGAVAMDSVGQWIVDTYSLQGAFDNLQGTFEEYSFLAILAAAVTPIPYKVFTIAAGACALPLTPFVVASVAGRGFRFMLEAVLIFFYGPPIRAFIERYFDRIAWLFLGLLVIGFLVIKLVL